MAWTYKKSQRVYCNEGQVKKFTPAGTTKGLSDRTLATFGCKSLFIYCIMQLTQWTLFYMIPKLSFPGRGAGRATFAKGALPA
jgi:hypothetical protein